MAQKAIETSAASLRPFHDLQESCVYSLFVGRKKSQSEATAHHLKPKPTNLDCREAQQKA